MNTASNPQDTGLEMIDLLSDSAFASRQLHQLHQRDAAAQIQALSRLSRAFVEAPETILQELVDTAVDMCGADSAGISLEKTDEHGQPFYHWVATAGSYKRFLHANLPPHPSACGICLKQGRPQLFRVLQPFFDLMGIEAEIVTDGILIPWQVEETRGTIWILAHGRNPAFDNSDYRMMQSLADFAAIGVRQQRQQSELVSNARNAGAAAMADKLAHKINNPLQSMTNVLFLAEHGENAEAKALAQQLGNDVDRLSGLVKQLLALPFDKK